jgi:uncharacterized membrane protein YbaN (DUF454 family)
LREETSLAPRPSLIRTIAGLLLIIVGLVGMLLPVMPGIPFLIAGVAMVGVDHPVLRPFRRLLARFRR